MQYNDLATIFLAPWVSLYMPARGLLDGEVEVVRLEADRVALRRHALAEVPHGALHLAQVLQARLGLLLALGRVAAPPGQVQEVLREGEVRVTGLGSILDTLLGGSSFARFCKQEFGEFPRLVGRFCSYLLPKQAGGTPQILVYK